MHKIRFYVLNTLLASILFVSVHTLIHNVHDHDHFDSSCAVYVLEELFVSSDVIDSIIYFVLFAPFMMATWLYSFHSHRVSTLFTIRAPPRA